MPKNKGVVQSSKEEHRMQVRAENLKATDAQQSRYQRYQRIIFTFLDRPATTSAYCYHVINLSLILGSIITSVLSTVAYFSKSDGFRQFLLYYEVGLLTWFTVEYFFRVWSCVIVSKWKGWPGRFRFVRSFYMIVDGFVILTTLCTILLQVKHSYFTMLRITRFLQVFRVLRLDRQRGDLRTMGHVVYKHKKELVTCYFVGFIILFGGTYIIYIIEKSHAKPSIDNMANGIYWAMITVTSVGYGDISPQTWAGKICTGIFALVGCAFFALPAGILGSGFALQVAKQKKEQRYTKVKNPAAVVIQNLWRNHAVKRSRYQLQGTWSYLFPQVNCTTNRSGYYGLLPGVKAIHDDISFDTFRASVGRKKTESSKQKKSSSRQQRRKKQSSVNNPCIPLSPRKKFSSISSFATQMSMRKESSFGGTSSDDGGDRELISKTSIKSRPSTNVLPREVSVKKKSKEKLPLTELISNRYKAAIRFILRVKYFTLIKRFKKERYPFVNVQDIMEKNSHDHIETLAYLKDIKKFIEDFQTELEDMKIAFEKYQIMHKTNPSLMSPLLNSQGLKNNVHIEEVDDKEGERWEDEKAGESSWNDDEDDDEDDGDEGIVVLINSVNKKEEKTDDEEKEEEKEGEGTVGGEVKGEKWDLFQIDAMMDVTITNNPLHEEEMFMDIKL